MSRAKHGPKASSLLVLALCVAAFAAAPASAEIGANWKVKGINVTAELSPAVAVKEIEGKDATFLTNIAGIKVEYLCTELQPISVKLKPEGFVSFESQLKFSGCLTKLNGTTSGGCEPLNEGKEPGVIKSNLLKGLLVKQETTSVIRFEPTSGETLASIQMGSECALGEKISLLGKVALKDSALGTESVEHLTSEASLTEMWVISKTPEHKVTIDGSMLFKLAGAHAGLAWSGTVAPPPTPIWSVKGSPVTPTLSPLVAVKEIESSDATLLTKIAGTKVEVLCTGAQLTGMKLEPEGAITSGSQIKLSGCLTKLNEKESGVCEPSNEGTEPGAIASKPLKGLLVTHEKSGIARFEPTSGETIATIETSKECSIGEKISLLGKVTLKDGSLTTEAETHLVSVGPLTELWAISKTEEHKITLDGSAVTRLASTHAGLLWKGTIPVSPPAWRVNGLNVSAALSPSVAVTEIEGKDATLLTKLSGASVEFLCTTLQPISVKLEPEGFVGFGSQLKYTGCITKLKGVTNGACEPVSEGKEPGVLKTKSLKGALVAHESAGLVRFEPLTGETLATFEFGEECAIGEKITLLGKFTLKDSSLSVDQVQHLASEGLLTEMWVNSKTAEHQVVVDGSITFKLAGAHAGLTWSGTV